MDTGNAIERNNIPIKDTTYKVVNIDIVDDDIEVPSFPKPHARQSTALAVNPTGLLGIGNARASSTAESFKPPELVDIIAGRRLTPFSRQDFRSYLIKRSIEELLDYYLNVFEFRSRFKKDVQAKIKDAEKEAYVVAKCLSSNVKDPVEIGKAIVNEFIREGAKKEINISATQRNEILRYFFPEEFANKMKDQAKREFREAVVDEQERNIVDPVSVFDNSLNEVEQLMYMNAYQEFLRIASTMNISDHESWAKMKKSLMATAVAAVVLAVIIWAESVGRLKTRWVRLIIFPLLFMVCAGMEAYRSKLCIVCAHFNTTTVSSDFESADGKKKDIVKQVCDMFAKEAIARRARLITIRVFVSMLFLIGIALALPPYNTM